MKHHEFEKHCESFVNLGFSRFLQMFSSAVMDQALLSAASLLVGVVLIRHTSDLQYGLYILVLNAVLLTSSLQNAFIGPAMILRMTRMQSGQRAELVGGIHREQRQLTGGAAVIVGVGVSALWAAGVLDSTTGPLMLAALATAMAALNREFFRMVLLAHRRPGDVLKADALYVILLVAGAAAATLTAKPAVAAVITMGLAALVGTRLLSQALQRHEAWSDSGTRGILRSIAPLGMWSAAGAAIHWTFSQGYTYLVAGTLDVTAVAAIAATRLLLMPVNLLSTGIGSLMLPLASGWLQEHGARLLLRRLALFSGGLALVALCYFAIMWGLRDWIFESLLRKHFAHRDELLMLWSAIFLLMVIRDQIIYLLVARERFRQLTSLAAFTALTSLATSYGGMLHFGLPGALLGMLLGEIVNVAGILTLTLRECLRGPPEPLPA